MTDSPLMTAKDVSDYLHVSEHTLANWRYLDTGPPFVKAGGKVLYRRNGVDEWLESNATDPQPAA